MFDWLAKFVGAWLGYATPQRADFESVQTMWKGLAEELKGELVLVRIELAASNKLVGDLEAKVDKLTAICRHWQKQSQSCHELRQQDLERLRVAEEKIRELTARAAAI